MHYSHMPVRQPIQLSTAAEAHPDADPVPTPCVEIPDRIRHRSTKDFLVDAAFETAYWLVPAIIVLADAVLFGVALGAIMWLCGFTPFESVKHARAAHAVRDNPISADDAQRLEELLQDFDREAIPRPELHRAPEQLTNIELSRFAQDLQQAARKAQRLAAKGQPFRSAKAS